ncbi:hypothetical protein PIB30_060270 [Stylosanthes scabra]|uniref:Uncharacterized protein n=1 Tax=Stylosanthes scabra TaxID=79078 RepID=A0ABU6SKI7_9FABA|nr:hypothetical protein [Stylosanthes scabra]
MDDSGRGFLSFCAHRKMKIFDFSDESSNFKEMYLKISGAPKIQPFYHTSEKKAKFCLYWQHLNLKDLMCDDEIAKRVAVDMAGGLDNLIAMRRRLITKQQISGDKEASSLATADLTRGTPVAREPVELEQSEEKVPSPQSSPAKKRKRVPREITEESGTLVNALEKDFNSFPFVDQYLMT